MIREEIIQEVLKKHLSVEELIYLGDNEPMWDNISNAIKELLTPQPPQSAVEFLEFLAEDNLSVQHILASISSGQKPILYWILEQYANQQKLFPTTEDEVDAFEKNNKIEEVPENYLSASELLAKANQQKVVSDEKKVCTHLKFEILGCPYDNQECEKCDYFKLKNKQI